MICESTSFENISSKKLYDFHKKTEISIIVYVPVCLNAAK
jgi:hypothetical protein